MAPRSPSGLLAVALLGAGLLLLAARLFLVPVVRLPLNFLVVFIVVASSGVVALYAVAVRRDFAIPVLATLAVGLLAAFWLLAEAVGGGGGSPQVTLGEADSGRTVTVSRGTQVMVQLPANPSTGYAWVATISDPSVLHQSGEPVFKPSTSALGADGTYTIWYEAGATGRTTLKLEYLRSWEAGVAPLKTFEVQVVVS